MTTYVVDNDNENARDILNGDGAFDNTLYGLGDWWMPSGLSFQITGIEQGDTIDSAKFGVWWQDNVNWGTITIYGEDADSGQDFTSALSSLEKTDGIAWAYASHPSGGSGGYVDGPEIKTIVQVPVDQPGWSAGNRMTFQTGLKEESGAVSQAYSYNDASAKAPRIVITFTPSGGVTLNANAIAASAVAVAATLTPGAVTLSPSAISASAVAPAAALSATITLTAGANAASAAAAAATISSVTTLTANAIAAAATPASATITSTGTAQTINANAIAASAAPATATLSPGAATITAAAISAAADVPSATISSSTTLSASAVASSAAAVAATLSPGSVTLTAGVVAALSNVPAATITGGAGGIVYQPWGRLKWTLNPSWWPPGTEFKIVVVMSTSSGELAATARFYNETDGLPIAISDVTTTSLTPGPDDDTDLTVESGAFTLTPGLKRYRVEWGGVVGGTYTLFGAAFRPISA